MEFQLILLELVTDQSISLCLAQSFDHLLVTKAWEQIHMLQWLWVLCKAADLNRQAVWENGIHSDFNETAQPLQMAAKKLGINIWQDSGLITTKVGSQKNHKWKSKIEISRDQQIRLQWVDKLQFKDFLSNLLQKILIYCVNNQPPITRSRRSVLNFKFSVLTFLSSMTCPMSIEQKLWEEKIFQL